MTNRKKNRRFAEQKPPKIKKKKIIRKIFGRYKNPYYLCTLLGLTIAKPSRCSTLISFSIFQTANGQAATRARRLPRLVEEREQKCKSKSKSESKSMTRRRERQTGEARVQASAGITEKPVARCLRSEAPGKEAKASKPRTAG